MSVHHKDLHCSVIAMHYSWDTREGKIWFPQYDCCDMTGCIQLFERVDPSVQLIITYSGGEVDTVYRRKSKAWVASDRLIEAAWAVK